LGGSKTHWMDQKPIGWIPIPIALIKSPLDAVMVWCWLAKMAASIIKGWFRAQRYVGCEPHKVLAAYGRKD